MALDLFEITDTDIALPASATAAIAEAERERLFAPGFAMWWLATALGAAADVATTGVALSIGLPERNPLYPLLLALFGPATLLAMALLKLPILGVLVWLRSLSRRGGLMWAVVACLVQLAYAIVNLAALLISLHILQLHPAM